VPRCQVSLCQVSRFQRPDIGPWYFACGVVSGSSYIFQVSWKSVEGFGAVGSRIALSLSHWQGPPWLIQQLVLQYKPWYRRRRRCHLGSNRRNLRDWNWGRRFICYIRYIATFHHVLRVTDVHSKPAGAVQSVRIMVMAHTCIRSNIKEINSNHYTYIFHYCNMHKTRTHILSQCQLTATEKYHCFAVPFGLSSWMFCEYSTVLNLMKIKCCAVSIRVCAQSSFYIYAVASK